MNRLLPLSTSFIFLLWVLFVTTGCGSGGTQLRVLQGSPFETSVNVLNNGNTVASGVAYGTATAYFSAGSGSPHVQIELPNSTTPILDQMLSLSGSNSTFVLVSSSNSFSGFLISDDNSSPSSGNANLRILNASLSLSSSDVYVLQPPANISAVNATVSGLAFKNASGYQSLAPGTYEVVFAFPGTKISAADSGAFTLSAGQVRTVSAIANLSSSTGSDAVVLADAN